MKLEKLTLILALFLVLGTGYAQKGTIRGAILDEEVGEALIGATAQIAGTAQGAVTDMDGKFNILNVEPGTYTLQISYLGYQARYIENVIVKSGDVTVLDLRLRSE